MTRKWKNTLRAALLLSATSLAGVLQAQQTLRPEPPSGYAAGLFGEEMAAVGAEVAITAGRMISIYRRSGGGWHAVQHLPAEPDFPMYRLAMAKSWMAVATRDVGVSGWPNYIDLYRRVGNDWTFAQRLNSPMEGTGGYVSKMAMTDTSVAVTLDELRDDGSISRRRVYVYDLNGDVWGAPQQLSPPYYSLMFGEGLAASEDKLIVVDSTIILPGGRGAVSTFVRKDGAWHHASVLSSHVSADYRFGHAIAICGRYLAVSSIASHSTPPPETQGFVTIYRGEPEQWTADADSIVTPVGYDATFGDRLACSESTLAIGSARTRGAYAVSFDGDRAVGTHFLTDPQASNVNFRLAVAGGDMFVGDPRGPWVSGSPQNDGAVYVFPGVGEFVSTLDFD